jgi:signal transduction histidine kinase
MTLMSGTVAAYTEADLDVLKLVATQVTPAIQNAVSHQQALQLAEAKAAEARAETRSQELEKINRAKSQFLSIVSHELRTPLTSIIAYAELLSRNSDGSLSAKQVQQASIINKSATHLKFLISDLLDVSRIESGHLSLDMEKFDLRQVIDDLSQSLKPVFSEKGQRLVTRISRGKLNLYGDRSRIAQVISNLLENSAKYSARETTVLLDVHRRRDELVITVTDQGYGIPQEDFSQLFTPFFRGNNTLTRSEPGTGLGLALVKRITELHGGQVSVTSSAGEGATFTVVLPAAAASKAA